MTSPRLVLACLLIALSAASAAAKSLQTVDLSPAAWPAGELELYTRLNQQSGWDRPRVTANKGMIAGTTGALAVRAGLAALEQGGSATDAALTTALTQITLAAGSWVSYAGIMVHFDAETGKPRYVDGGFNTLLEEDDPLSIPSDAPSGRTVLVPGFMAAVEAAHRSWGVVPFAELFAPATYFAEQGFPVDRDLALTMEFRRGVLQRLPATREIFFKADGSLYRTGEIFTQPQLAATLREVARQGASYMYDGAWGERLVAAVEAEGGRLTGEDLRAYEVVSRRPKKARFREYVFHLPNKPGAGGVLAGRALKALKAADLAAMGHYTESADSLFALLQATRDQYRLVPPLGAHSDAVVAIDERGNAVALLHSINTLAWGRTGLFVDGVSIPDAAAQQQRRVADAGPGKRLWNPVNPLVVTRKKAPVLASSAIGNGLFEATLQSVVNVLEYGMDPKRAVDTPMFRSPLRVAGGIGASRVGSGDFDPALLAAIRDRGIPITELPRSNLEGTGFWVGIERRGRKGKLVGAATELLNGLTLGH